jgi:hypothetical protein
MDIFWRNHWQKEAVYSEGALKPKQIYSSVYRTDKYKLLWHAEESKLVLYDMIADPSETNDIAIQFPETVEKMKKEMLSLTGFHSLDESKPHAGGIDRDISRPLRALGYLQ